MPALVDAIEFGPADVLDKMISKKLTSTESVQVLDIGSGGAAYWSRLLKKYGAGIQVTLMDPVAPERLSLLQQNGQVTHIGGFAPQDLSGFRDQTFDIVVAIDLIEHLEKSNGFLLLYELDRLCRWQSLIFTPNGLVPQPPSKNNKFNAHISGWTPAELARFGWVRQRGHTGFKRFFGGYGAPLPHTWFGQWAARSTALAVRWFPRFAFSFSARKQHSGISYDHYHDGVL